MGRAALALLLPWVLLFWRGAASVAQDIAPIQRHLLSLRLGDHLKEVQVLFPPTRDWPSYLEPGTRLTRVQIRRSSAKYFPDGVETLWLGLRWGRLVYVQAVFDSDSTAKEPLEKMVVELSTMYGEPQRRGMKYLWRDGSTVLRASGAEVPAADGQGVELRKSLELMDKVEYRP